MEELIDLLHRGAYSCVIRSHDGEIHFYHGRGVTDLYRLVCCEKTLLKGADIADKVVGKGAAALMISGGVRAVYADVISEPAAELLDMAGVAVTFGQRVPHIINRSGTGQCPLEKRCGEERSIEKLLPIIKQFVKEISK